MKLNLDQHQAPAPEYVAKATRAAIEFESFFIGHMLHQMRASVRALAPEDSPSRDRVNQDMTGMVDDMLAGHLAGQRAFGVADAILRQLNETSQTVASYRGVRPKESLP